MKINTKKCINIFGSPYDDATALIHPNKYIVYDKSSTSPFATPSKDETKLNDQKPKDSPFATPTDELGRQIKYIPTIVYTPVLVSKRCEEKTSNRRRMFTSEDVDELNGKLKELLSIQDDNNHNNKNDDEDEERIHNHQTTDTAKSATTASNVSTSNKKTHHSVTFTDQDKGVDNKHDATDSKTETSDAAAVPNVKPDLMYCCTNTTDKSTSYSLFSCSMKYDKKTKSTVEVTTMARTVTKKL